ncbi:MAG: hypothetical protein CL847_05640 [Crocinitomicaceae bacterium]|nr:hypothetical protein [Crocinitomicaceae bacterium]|tara:strand:+ start:13250 stop:13834 length:585 start_codon:yes stop_codon:yes gene_type:complete
MKIIYFLFFSLIGFTGFTQSLDIVFIDFENSESNNFDKDFYLSNQASSLLDIVDNSDDLVLILMEKNLSHVMPTKEKAKELINHLTDADYGYQSITNVPYWDEQIRNLINEKSFRDKISTSISQKSAINITFIANDSSSSTKNGIIEFYNQLSLVFDLYNSSGFIDNLTSNLYSSYNRSDQNIINLNDEIKNAK